MRFFQRAFLCFFLAGAACRAEEIRLRDFCLDITSAGGFSLKAAGGADAFPPADVFFQALDGRRNALAPLALKEIKFGDGSAAVTYSGPDFEWRLRLTAKGSLALVSSEITGSSAAELWLEPRVRIKLASAAGFTECWTGRKRGDKTPGPGGSLRQAGLKYEGEVAETAGTLMPFPAAALSDGKTVLFAGGVPFDTVSYFASEITGEGDGSAGLCFSNRIVVAPGKKTAVNFTLGAAGARHGLQDGVVQVYYDSMPDLFAPAAGEDNPYIWGAHGQYLTWYREPDFESCRRLFVTLEWGYVPYKRSGDILCRQELWDYTPLNPMTVGLPILGGLRIDFSKTGGDEFRETRRRRFQKYGRDFGWMFYNGISGTWCEKQLAAEKYPDSVSDDETAVLFKQKWDTAHDQVVRTFPYGTSMGAAFENDIKELVNDLNPPGFAVDCGYGGVYYRGPGVKKDIPGRAWDEKGVFIDQSVAFNHITDYIHSLRQADGSAPVVFINGYLKGDYVMRECSFLHVLQFGNMEPLYSYYQGQRPGCVHGREAFNFKAIYPGWKQFSRGEFEDNLSKLADYALFCQFKYGLTLSCAEIRGCPQNLYVMPEVIEMMRIGRQAVVPLEFGAGDKQLMTARYGRGSSSCLFIGNPNPEGLDLKLSVDNKYLGDMDYVFVRKMRDFASSVNSLEGGKTRIDYRHDSRVPCLYEAVCGLRAPAALKCVAKSKKDVNSVTFSVTFSQTDSFESDIELKRIYGFTLRRASLDGAGLALDTRNGSILAKSQKIKRNSSLVIEYTSNIFNATAAEILGFNFCDGSKTPSFTVRAPLGAGERTLQCAGLFPGYFEFCGKNKILGLSAPRIKTELTDTINSARDSVILAAGQKLPPEYAALPRGVSMINGNLVIKAGENEDLMTLVKAALRVMDRKFEWCPPFDGFLGLTYDVKKHFGIDNAALPCKRYFENAISDGGGGER